jgi:hypothetical protein
VVLNPSLFLFCLQHNTSGTVPTTASSASACPACSGSACPPPPWCVVVVRVAGDKKVLGLNELPIRKVHSSSSRHVRAEVAPFCFLWTLHIFTFSGLDAHPESAFVAERSNRYVQVESHRIHHLFMLFFSLTTGAAAPDIVRHSSPHSGCLTTSRNVARVELATLPEAVLK